MDETTNNTPMAPEEGAAEEQTPVQEPQQDETAQAGEQTM